MRASTFKVYNCGREGYSFEKDGGGGESRKLLSREEKYRIMNLDPLWQALAS